MYMELDPAVRECLSDDEGEEFEEQPYTPNWGSIIVVDHL